MMIIGFIPSLSFGYKRKKTIVEVRESARELLRDSRATAAELRKAADDVYPRNPLLRKKLLLRASRSRR